MNKDRIMSLNGRDMDGEIAIHFFGWQWYLSPRREKEKLVGLWPSDDFEWDRLGFACDMICIGKSYDGYKRYDDWFKLACPKDQHISSTSFLPHFSSSMTDTWLLVEKIVDMDYGKIHIDCSHYHGCHVWASNEEKATDRMFVAEPKEVPLAICKAALLLIEGKENG
jgi:hypothetical protein